MKVDLADQRVVLVDASGSEVHGISCEGSSQELLEVPSAAAVELQSHDGAVLRWVSHACAVSTKQCMSCTALPHATGVQQIVWLPAGVAYRISMEASLMFTSRISGS